MKGRYPRVTPAPRRYLARSADGWLICVRDASPTAAVSLPSAAAIKTFTLPAWLAKHATGCHGHRSLSPQLVCKQIAAADRCRHFISLVAGPLVVFFFAARRGMLIFHRPTHRPILPRVLYRYSKLAVCQRFAAVTHDSAEVPPFSSRPCWWGQSASRISLLVVGYHNVKFGRSKTYCFSVHRKHLKDLPHRPQPRGQGRFTRENFPPWMSHSAKFGL